VEVGAHGLERQRARQGGKGTRPPAVGRQPAAPRVHECGAQGSQASAVRGMCLMSVYVSRKHTGL
jgi:hypothetical protein